MLVWEIDCGRRARRAARYAVGVNSEVPCSLRVSSTAESTTAACARERFLSNSEHWGKEYDGAPASDSADLGCEP